MACFGRVSLGHGIRQHKIFEAPSRLAGYRFIFRITEMSDGDRIYQNVRVCVGAEKKKRPMVVFQNSKNKQLPIPWRQLPWENKSENRGTVSNLKAFTVNFASFASVYSHRGRFGDAGSYCRTEQTLSSLSSCRRDVDSSTFLSPNVLESSHLLTLSYPEHW